MGSIRGVTKADIAALIRCPLHWLNDFQLIGGECDTQALAEHISKIRKALKCEKCGMALRLGDKCTNCCPHTEIIGYEDNKGFICLCKNCGCGFSLIELTKDGKIVRIEKVGNVFSATTENKDATPSR